jgi:hypothetical protein
MAAPKQTDPQFKLRMPQKLKDDLERAVEISGRSLNAEIVWRLELSFEIDDVASKPAAQAQALAPLLQAVDKELRQRFEPYIASLNRALDVALSPDITDDQRAEMRAGLAGADTKQARPKRATKAPTALTGKRS